MWHLLYQAKRTHSQQRPLITYNKDYTYGIMNSIIIAKAKFHSGKHDWTPKS